MIISCISIQQELKTQDSKTKKLSNVEREKTDIDVFASLFPTDPYTAVVLYGNQLIISPSRSVVFSISPKVQITNFAEDVLGILKKDEWKKELIEKLLDARHPLMMATIQIMKMINKDNNYTQECLNNMNKFTATTSSSIAGLQQKI